MSARAMLSAILVLSCASFAHADPVELRQTSTSSVAEYGACALWIEPAGDDYEWTDVCVGDDDRDGDGSLERIAFVQKSLCDEDGSSGGTWCWTEGPLVVDEVNDGEASIAQDLAAASLHADVEDCRVDLDWTGTGETEVFGGSGDARPFVSSTDGVSIGIRQPRQEHRMRDAAVTGAVCLAADVTGAPAYAFLARSQEGESETSVRVAVGGYFRMLP